ncbi:Imm74 family immunity protein [Streptococcus acidominimus]|uniref:Imm74 family immunity protein n=1 Tax=Streptococcus acidominimus TaxID=1326 RepID=UPI001F566B5D|nr:Imm74 family immunity protein [Streptococcus acidominimus]
MKISGTRSSITFDLENGYILKAQGELLVNNRFAVYKDSMNSWEPPFDTILVTQQDVENIINEVKNTENEQTVHIEFI